MIIKDLLLSDCSEGDMLASDVINSCGVPLIAKDTIINEYIIDKLSAHGINKISIYNKSSLTDEKFKMSYTNTVQHTKVIFQNMISGKNLDIQNLTFITKQIYNNITESDKIFRCMEKMQNADEYTYTHCVNVAFYSMLIAKWLDMSEEEINKAIQSGLLHDLGKVKIPDYILNKKGILTREEFEIIKNHTILGYKLVKEMKELDEDIKMAILLHHERMDGTGYPYQYNQDNKDLNIYSRIVAIADVFDAMTTDRVYKKRSTPFDVFDMFQTVGVSMFDTTIMDVLIKKMVIYLIGAKVILTSGNIGEIVFIPLQNVTCPIIKVSSKYIDLYQEDTVKISCMLS